MDRQQFQNLERVARTKANDAIQLDHEGKYAEALDAYVAAGSALSELARFTSNNQEMHQNMAMVYFQRAEALEKSLVAAPPPRWTAQQQPPHHHHQQQQQQQQGRQHRQQQQQQRQQQQHQPPPQQQRQPPSRTSSTPSRNHSYSSNTSTHTNTSTNQPLSKAEEEAASLALIQKLMQEEQAALNTSARGQNQTRTQNQNHSQTQNQNQNTRDAREMVGSESTDEDSASLALAQKLMQEEQEGLNTDQRRRRQVEDAASLALIQSLTSDDDNKSHSPLNSESSTLTSNHNSQLQSTTDRIQHQSPLLHQTQSNGHELVDFLSLPERGSKVFATITLTTDQNTRYKGQVHANQKDVKHVVEQILRGTQHQEANKNKSGGDDNNTNANNKSNKNNNNNNNNSNNNNNNNNINNNKDSESNPTQGVDVDDDGRIMGATHNLNPLAEGRSDSRPDSGVAYREKNWQDLVKRSQDKVGPPQKAFQEKISITERQEAISRAGTRVNPSSKQRAFAIDGYEKKTFIDPNRSIDIPLPRETPLKLVSGQTKDSITNTAALFETAAMGAKLRNTHKVGGERVKTMDHFVASVETPRVNLKIPDIADLVTEVAVDGLTPITIDETSGTLLHVQPRFRNEDGSVSTTIAMHATMLFQIVDKICREFLEYTAPIELFYMTTIRADVSVCSLAKKNNRLYFNVLVFQQQQVADLSTGGVRDHRRVWRYWLQRAAMALAGSQPTTPTGLYDKTVRLKFNTFLTQLDAMNGVYVVQR